MGLATTLPSSFTCSSEGMMMRIIRIVLGMFLIGIVLYLVNGVLIRKSYYMESIVRFLSSSDIEVDIIGFGSSHMYCTLNPVEIFRRAKLRSYVACTQRQPVEITYNYIKRALSVHYPKVVILETLMFFNSPHPTEIEAGVAHDALDPIPYDWDKCRMVFSSSYLTNVDSLILPFLKYHSRWKELGFRDWRSNMTPDKNEYPIMGFRLFGNVVSNNVKQIDYGMCQPSVLDEYYVEILNRIAQLVSSHGAQLVLLTAPLNAVSGEKFKSGIRAIDEFAKAKGIPHVDMLRDFDRTAIDGAVDFHDRTHLNVWGSEKASRYIAKKLLGHFNLKANDDLETLAKWESECRRYDEIKASFQNGRNAE